MTLAELFAVTEAARIESLRVRIDRAKRRKDFRTVRVLLADLAIETANHHPKRRTP